MQDRLLARVLGVFVKLFPSFHFYTYDADHLNFELISIIYKRSNNGWRDGFTPWKT
jgi:hypothetical protein